MNCEWMETGLIAYLDSKANPAQRREIEAHLAHCAACRARVQEFRQLWGVLDDLPVMALPASFDASLRARIAREPGRAGFFSWLALTPRMAFAVTALVAISIWLFSFQPVHPQTKASASMTGSDAEFRMINNLPTLEDYDVLANFDPLSELPAQPAAPVRAQQPQM